MSGANEAAIRALASRRRLPESHLAKWLAMDASAQAAFLELADRLKLRTGQIVAAIDLLDEISVRETITPGAILARDEIHRACASNGSAPTRAAVFLDALRAIRFPRLKRATERMSSAIVALRLPPSVRVVLPANLASDELMVQISARTGAEMERSINALAEKKPGLIRLVSMLSGDDEV